MAESDKKFSFSPRTDLAIEAHETLEEQALDGIKAETQKTDYSTITKVFVTSENASQKLGKPKGTYITIESDLMKKHDVTAHENIIKEVSQNISELIDFKKDGSILIIGLGNWDITPDALGPKVVSKILVTRHIMDNLPEELEGGVSSVAAFAPGVMGITGVETLEVVKGLVERVKPHTVIAIDALAARNTSRINSTIQISNAGIAPGAGVGNRRKELSINTLGVPVIAVGVPTVVDAATLINDALDRILEDMKKASKEYPDFYESLSSLHSQEKYGLICSLLNPYEENMFVTPKEVDEVIDRLAYIIANAINISLHKGIHLSDINRYKA